MNSYTVEINYGKKAPAFEAVVSAHNEHDAKKQAQDLAKISGWSESPRRIKISGEGIRNGVVYY